MQAETELPDKFIVVCGFNKIIFPYFSWAVAVTEPLNLSCQFFISKKSANLSRNKKPALCLVKQYLSPGFPKPTNNTGAIQQKRNLLE